MQRISQNSVVQVQNSSIPPEMMFLRAFKRSDKLYACILFWSPEMLAEISRRLPVEMPAGITISQRAYSKSKCHFT